MAAGSPSSAAPPEEIKPIPINRKEAASHDKKLQIILGAEPYSVRGIDVEAPVEAAGFFFLRPSFAVKLLAEEEISGPSIEKDEDGGWVMKSGSGASLVFRLVKSSRRDALLRFTFLQRAPVGIGLKISGSGVLAIRMNKGEKNASTIDYDVYLVKGSLPLDEPASAFGAQAGLVLGEVDRATKSFVELCETAWGDAELVIKDMEREKEVFTKDEIADFRRAFGKGRK